MTYDHWKTTEPDDPTLACDVCGSRLRKDMRTGRFYCEKCEPEDEDWPREEARIYLWTSSAKIFNEP